MDNLTVVIPFYNGHTTIGRLLESLPAELPVLVVDDKSDNALRLDSIEGRDIRILRPKEKGYFTGAVNFGIDACDTDVLILNQDVWFKGTQWLTMLEENRETYATIGEGIQGNHPAWPKSYIHGTFMFIRRDAWNEVGPMNARDYPLWGSTCLWQLQAARKGYRALPVRTIPGMEHERTNTKAAYGSAISQVLKENPADKGLFIKTPPAISVVINCYNHGRYLEDAVNSLIGGSTSLGKMPGQTFQSFEIVIVNDGSTDDTAEICNSLVDRWKGIRCLHQPNAGSAAASNTGIEAAYGGVIAILDADDMMLSHRLEDMYRALESNPHSMIFDDIIIFDKDGMQKQANGEIKAWKMPTYDFNLIKDKNTVHKGIMFPKKAWADVGGYPEIMNKGREDWAFNVGLGRLGWCGVRVTKPGYLYRRQGQNRTLRNTTPTWRAHFRAQLESLYPDVYSGRYPVGCCGGSNKRNQPSRNNRGASKVGGNLMAAPGQSGMVKMEYIGLNVGDSTYYGNASHTTYVFGGNRKVGFVDNRDVQQMLDLYRSGRPLFQMYTEPEKPAAVEYVPEEEKPEMPKPAADAPTAIIEEVTVGTVAEEEAPDPNTMTVSKIKEEAPGWSHEQLQFALLAEKQGQGRKTAIKVLEELLNVNAVPA